GAAGHEVVEGNDLGADEAALKVGVNLARRLRSLGSLLDGPGADLRLSGGEIGNEAEQRIAGVDQTIEAGLGKAHVGEEKLLLLGLEAGDLRLDFGGNRQHG